MGYKVCGIAKTGQQATAMACRLRPEAAIIDINLDGQVDGIEACDEISQKNIAVVYFEQYHNEHTLERARNTGALGYFAESQSDKQIRGSIELAIHGQEETNRIQKEITYMHCVVESMGLAIISVDIAGRIAMMNKTAEELTGYTQAEALTQRITDIFQVKTITHDGVANPVMKVIKDLKRVSHCAQYVLLNKQGDEIHIDDCISPIIDNDQCCRGAVIVFGENNSKEKDGARIINKAGKITAIFEPMEDKGLSKREQEVLRLIAEGKCNKEAAGELFISVRTIEFHRERIMKKLKVNNMADLTKAAIRLGLCKLAPTEKSQAC
jgi:PAS domain S-box-containing protein